MLTEYIKDYAEKKRTPNHPVKMKRTKGAKVMELHLYSQVKYNYVLVNLDIFFKRFTLIFYFPFADSMIIQKYQMDSSNYTKWYNKVTLWNRKGPI